jgi:hypothetical protein
MDARRVYSNAGVDGPSHRLTMSLRSHHRFISGAGLRDPSTIATQTYKCVPRMEMRMTTRKSISIQEIVGSNTETVPIEVREDLEVPVRQLVDELARTRRDFLSQLEPFANLVAHHAVPGGMKKGRAIHALAETAYRRAATITADICADYSIDPTVDQEACNAFYVVMQIAATSIANDSYREAAIERIGLPASSYVH